MNAVVFGFRLARVRTSGSVTYTYATHANAMALIAAPIRSKRRLMSASYSNLDLRARRWL
jgi:hypothetical protein